GAALGRAVELLEIAPDGTEELHHLRPESGAARDRRAYLAEAQLVAERLEDEPAAERAQHPEPRSHGLAFELELGHQHPAREEELRQPALEPVGVLDPHLRLAANGLPD